MEVTPPDVLLLGTEWPQRAALRAQLLEDGYEVIAVDAWPIPRPYRQPGLKPRLLIVDLQGLPSPREVLDEIRFVMPPKRVLVIAALGTVSSEHIAHLGYHVIPRPARIGDIVDTVARLLQRGEPRSA
jgi:hypothetical protein